MPHFDKAGPENHATDLHETHPELVFALAVAEALPFRILEPACGRGAIVRALEQLGHMVGAADVRAWRGRPAQADVRDYLAGPAPWSLRRHAVVTNPPFKLAAAFAERGILDGNPLVCLLLRVGFFAAGSGNTDAARARRFVLDERPPARVHVFRRRPERMHKRSWTGNEASATLDLAWYVWDASVPPGPARFDRIDWHALPTNRGLGQRPPRGGG